MKSNQLTPSQARFLQVRLRLSGRNTQSMMLRFRVPPTARGEPWTDPVREPLYSRCSGLGRLLNPFDLLLHPVRNGSGLILIVFLGLTLDGSQDIILTKD